MKAIKKFFLKLMVIIIVLAMLAALVVMLINNHVKSSTKDDIAYIVRDKIVEINSTSLDELKKFDADCILVLGCGIKDKQTPTPMLADRLDVGIELYKRGVASKILLSGDNGQENHNEIHVMLKYTKEAGVPKDDIFCDHAGFSTYDSMYRAGNIFNVKKVIVVSQQYHEYRAIYIGKKLGLEVKGVAANQDSYFGQNYREAREILARNKDLFKSLLRSKPVYLGDVIPIDGSGISSHGE